LQEPAQIDINDKKLQDWLGRGALPSTTVKSLIKKALPAAE
jgi:small subunit ribosomal protein S16